MSFFCFYCPNRRLREAPTCLLLGGYNLANMDNVIILPCTGACNPNTAAADMYFLLKNIVIPPQSCWLTCFVILSSRHVLTSCLYSALWSALFPKLTLPLMKQNNYPMVFFKKRQTRRLVLLHHHDDSDSHICLQMPTYWDLASEGSFRRYTRCFIANKVMFACNMFCRERLKDTV